MTNIVHRPIIISATYEAVRNAEYQILFLAY